MSPCRWQQVRNESGIIVDHMDKKLIHIIHINLVQHVDFQMNPVLYQERMLLIYERRVLDQHFLLPRCQNLAQIVDHYISLCILQGGEHGSFSKLLHGFQVIHLLSGSDGQNVLLDIGAQTSCRFIELHCSLGQRLVELTQTLARINRESHETVRPLAVRVIHSTGECRLQEQLLYAHLTPTIGEWRLLVQKVK